MSSQRDKARYARVLANLDAPPRPRTMPVPRRCAWCAKAVMLEPDGTYTNDRGGPHRCKGAK